MTTLSNIRNDIFNDILQKRINIKVKTKTLNPEDYRTSTYYIVNEVFPDWTNDPRILFLAIDIWSERTFIVIDINNYAYDFLSAHEIKTVLPVCVLQKHKRRQDWVLARWPAEDEPLSEKLADLHNVTGFDAILPFLEDHTSRIVHENPRWLKCD
ncbi:uncharacterized protein N7473_007029 [Penicillium subrubescens]|jgi:hypothetical protein|uniref:Uncharacterized protein n=1 Tax=Penicillium subrubescens TaxID=1316194 RepID=A0A1Q5TG78_9EURO|nr:uncharacterized protein N7473_007029 [Penicillium subrubescens]KAJ5890801.1 hypothetical protein N7473_007029 [Penicillium subrubescens]OKO99232.1 hypothetical protein PENSUB_8619 [Penicillium subrubescens]